MSANHLIRDWTYELLLLIEQARAEAANDDGFTLGRTFGLAEASHSCSSKRSHLDSRPLNWGFPRKMQ